MSRRQQRPIYVVAVCSLLSIWLPCGGLAEAAQYIQENLSDGGGEKDDLEALAQLAFRIKSGLLTVTKTALFSVGTIAVNPSASAQVVYRQHRLPSLTVDGPHGRCRHQQICVYRI